MEKIPFKPSTDDTIVFVGNTFSEGFQRHNYFETLLYSNFPDKNLKVRNISWSADEVYLMPRPLNFPSLDEQLKKLKADVIFLSFGLNESYQGEGGVEDFKTNLGVFISSLKTQTFNGESTPHLILLSPIAYERLNGDFPEADTINYNLELYTNAMRDVAQKVEVDFVDLYHPVYKFMAQSTTTRTSNGIHLNDRGRIMVAEHLAQSLNLSTDA